MKKVNEVRDYVRPEVEEIDLALSANILEGSVTGTGQGSTGVDWGIGDDE